MGLLIVLLSTVVPLIALAFLEGASSFVLLALALGRGDQNVPLRESRHSRHDAELGWTTVPGISIPDMYGPNVPVRIDAQGFRVTGPRPAAPRQRIICSGDSFTFGVGVGDDRAWCSLLGRRDSQLATVNLGQAGYGVDQAYLWYKRNAMRLQHDVHLFAYITNDFLRMQGSSAFGYLKPTLAVDGDSLVARNTPVPRSEGRARRYWTAVVLRNQLRLAGLLLWVRDSVLGGHGAQQGSLSGEWTAEDSLTWLTVGHITADLARLNRAKGSTLVLIHLPVLEDYWTPQSDPWRKRAHAASREGRFVFVDLVEEFRALPADSVGQMFIGHFLPGYPDATGHYSVEGNEWVADQVHARLRASRVLGTAAAH